MTLALAEILAQLEKELGTEVTPVDDGMRFERLKKMIQPGAGFAVFGAGQAGKQLREFLAEQGATVRYIIDNNPKLNETTLDGLPVYTPAHLGKEGLKQCPIFIASMYFTEIAAQLTNDYGLASFVDYFVPHPFLFEVNVMGQGYNAELQDYLKKNWPSVLETANLWEAGPSRWLFFRYLYLRLYFLTPERLNRQLFEYDHPSYGAVLEKITDEHSQEVLRYMLKEKLYDFGRDRIMVEPGEHVIDGGAWIGDSALIFAMQTGAQGKVYSFEPTQHHADKIRETAKQTGLEQIIQVETSGLWSHTGSLKFSDSSDADGAGSYASEQGNIEIQVKDLDSYIGDQRIDFIKLDIEGSELEALKGARQILQKWRPKLAICLYHRPQDLHEIPLFLKSLNLGYRFHFTHSGTMPTDAILFAASDQR